MPTNYLILQDLPSTTQELTGPLAASAFYDGGGAVYNVRHPDYGATYDGSGQITNAAAVFQAAIEDANTTTGGGEVLVPAGVYILEARVRMRSNITLRFTAGSLVKSNGWGFENYSYATASSFGTDHDIGIVGLVMEDTSNAGTRDATNMMQFKYVDRLKIDRCRQYQTGTNATRDAMFLTAIRDSWFTNNNLIVSGDAINFVASANFNCHVEGNFVRGRTDLNVVPGAIIFWAGASDCRIIGNYCADVGDECIIVEGCSNMIVSGNTVKNPQTSAIDLRGASVNLVCTNNTCTAGPAWQGDALIRVFQLVGYPNTVLVEGNTVDVSTSGSPGPGIGVYDSGTYGVVVKGNTIISSTTAMGGGIVVKSGAKDVIIKGNFIRNVTTGIVLNACSVVTIEDNHVSLCSSNGIELQSGFTPSRITLRGNVCFNNGKTVPFCAGISVQGGDRIRLLENQGFDDQGTPTQSSAIIVANTVTLVVILDNDVSSGGMTIAAYNHANAPLLVRDNRGYITRAKNSVTVASGTSTLSVAHGMSRDFESVNNVRLTPRSTLGGLDYWVDDPTAGDGAFRINLSANAPAGGVSFAYEVWSDRMNAY